MKKIIALIAAGLLLSCVGCSIPGSHNPNSVQVVDAGVDGPGQRDDGVQSYGLGEGTSFIDSEIASSPDADLLKKRVFHFGFNQYQIGEADFPAIVAHAHFIAAHPDIRIRLEGNTDERGSREYNLALGEERAQSVANLLGAQGAKKSQIIVMSYGEENPMPSALGQTEEDYSLNRRVELKYLTADEAK